MSDSLSELLQRIASVGREPPYNSDRLSLLHAYVACFSYPNLCSAIAMTIGDPADVRLPLRGRLLRMLREGNADQDVAFLVTLVEQTATSSDKDKALRPAADALHSAVFAHLPLPTKRILLDRWIDRGTHSAMARWLKAAKEHPGLFDAEMALAYWRATKDSRAAKSLAYQASPVMLQQIVSELIRDCEQGWIISKAVIRAGTVDEECWQTIHAEHPATYLYLCAMSHRPITDDEAFELVCRCAGLPVESDRGLAIWAVGQMGMVSVLDRLLGVVEELQQRDLEEMLAQTSEHELVRGDLL